MINLFIFHSDKQKPCFVEKIQLVLIGFMTKLASHFERSTLERRTTMPRRSIVQTVSPVFAINSNPFMQYANNKQTKGNHHVEMG